MKHSEDLEALAAALASAQSQFTAIPKDSLNPFFKSKYADLPAVIAVAAPILSSCGLSVSQHPSSDDRGDTLVTWLLHDSGQYICDTMRLHLPQDNAQGQGSALTYARRYAYMSVLGLVADEDDDGIQASKPRPQQQQPVEAIVDLSGLVSALDQDKRKGLRGEWETKFGFPTNGVPKSQESEARALIKSWSA